MTPQQYFADHPEHRDDVMRAWYAYHAPHYRLTFDGHNFTSSLRSSKCSWCGRSREQVRWDELPPTCLARPVLDAIEDAIQYEERKAFALLDRASSFVPAFIDKHGMSGATLATLHHTHGFDPSTVDMVVTVSRAHLSEYEAEMEGIRTQSRKGRRVEVVSAKTA